MRTPPPDAIESANRCARALGSSLVLEEAFEAFIAELRGLVPLARAAIVLAEGQHARMMAAAGDGIETVYPQGSVVPIAGTNFEWVVATQETRYRPEMNPGEYPEEAVLIDLGLRARVVAPLVAARRAIGILAISRREPRSFSPQEIQLCGLLGRLVATAVQNIRAYDAERKTVEELRRLSELRADFASLVSHELRNPIASVSGAAQTLRGRWSELSDGQREAFFDLLVDESARLARLVAEVLDTSMIEAGTFSYSFGPVDVEVLVRSAARAAGPLRVSIEVAQGVPAVHADGERLRQVLVNLVENAIKYSPDAAPVGVRARVAGDRVLVEVSDRGSGIAPDDHERIFEKFGRATSSGPMRPGSGLGLFISRSIAEAHGGSLSVESEPGHGATFRLSLPVGSG